MSVEVASFKDLNLRPCAHQIQHPPYNACRSLDTFLKRTYWQIEHTNARWPLATMMQYGKDGSLVDDSGHFFKPLQPGPRGDRETAFYQTIQREIQNDSALPDLIRLHGEGLGNSLGTSDDGNSLQTWSSHLSNSSGRSSEDLERGRSPSSGTKASISGRAHSVDTTWEPFTKRNEALLRVIPRYYRLIDVDGRALLELEDLTRRYKHPSIVDIKVGLRTWYAGADPRHIERCKLKDAATTQAALGYKVCGMQVYRHCQNGYWRASKRWCKHLTQDAVSKALVRFADNEAGLCPAAIYGGSRGAIAQLKRLEEWFQRQRDFYFYSSSILIIYEGDAERAEDAKIATRLVDFAHTFPSDGKKDTNFLAGLRAIIKALTSVLHTARVDDL